MVDLAESHNRPVHREGCQKCFNYLIDFIQFEKGDYTFEIADNGVAVLTFKHGCGE